MSEDEGFNPDLSAWPDLQRLWKRWQRERNRQSDIEVSEREIFIELPPKIIGNPERSRARPAGTIRNRKPDISVADNDT